MQRSRDGRFLIQRRELCSSAFMQVFANYNQVLNIELDSRLRWNDAEGITSINLTFFCVSVVKE